MAAYLLIEIDVVDPLVYDEYVERVPPVVHRSRGRYLVRGEEVLPLAGDWAPERVVILEFPNRRDLLALVTSDEYQAVAPLRERSTRTRSVALEGVAKQP